MDTLAEVEIDSRRPSQKKKSDSTALLDQFEPAGNASNMEMIARFVPNRLVRFYNSKIQANHRREGAKHGSGEHSYKTSRVQSLLAIKARYEKLLCS